MSLLIHSLQIIAIGNFSKDCSEITKDDWKPYVSFKQ